MSKLRILLDKLINSIYRLMAHSVQSQPSATLPVIEVVDTDEIDPDELRDLEVQLLSGPNEDMQLLSVELSTQGTPRITVHPGRDIAKLLEEETLQMLDTEWNKAKRAHTG